MSVGPVPEVAGVSVRSSSVTPSRWEPRSTSDSIATGTARSRRSPGWILPSNHLRARRETLSGLANESSPTCHADPLSDRTRPHLPRISHQTLRPKRMMQSTRESRSNRRRSSSCASSKNSTVCQLRLQSSCTERAGPKKELSNELKVSPAEAQRARAFQGLHFRLLRSWITSLLRLNRARRGEREGWGVVSDCRIAAKEG